MRKRNHFRTALTLLLAVWLALPMTVLADKKVDTKKAKKNFSEGLKYEVEQKWDLAAQSFLLAMAADPGNAEYRLHATRALSSASLMFLKRGDEFAAENDFASAYTAYKQAATYDQTNEVAVVKMKRMIELQKAASGLSETPNINPRTGGYLPTSADIAPPKQQRGRAKDLAALVQYKDTPLKVVIQDIARKLSLNVIFDETFRDEPKYNLELQNTTLARALDFIFIQKKLTFEQLDRRTLLIYFDNPTNRQRFERLLVKTFYINNAKLEEVRTVVQQMLQGGGAGLMRQIAASTQLNALIVRAPAEDLKMVQEVIDSIDKNRAEVAIDVNIYEVTNNTSQQIGNQVALDPQTIRQQVGVDSRGNPIYADRTSGALNNLGGILGQGVISALGGSAFGIGSGFGALLAAPPTTLTLLQNRNNAKLVSRVNVHAIDGQSNKTNVGRRIPINLGFGVPTVGGFGNTTGGIGTVGTGTTGALGGLNTGFSNFGYNSFQYQDVGLNIDITPTITTEGYVEMKMTIESSASVPGSGAATLTPEITQRKLTTISRVLDGKTAVVAGVQQQTKSDGRSTIPVVGLIPILGRFITTPKESNDMSDIIITVTPHIIRAPQLEKKDHLAKESGTGLGGNFVSVEQIVSRAQEEDDQDRRIIAAQQGTPAQTVETTPVVAPLTPPAPTPAVVQQVRPEPTPAVAQPNPVKPQPAVNKPEPQPDTQDNNGAITEANAEDGGVAPPEHEPPPGYKPELKSPVLTQEQREAREAARVKAIEEMKKNPPKQPDPTQGGFEIPNHTPPPGYRPQLVPAQKKPKEKGTTPAQAANEPKEMSKVIAPTPPPEALSTSSADGQLGLSLKLNKDKKLQMGETFIVVVAVDGQSKMTGANIALNYDTNLLQLKSVRDGGMLGKNPDITQQDKSGHLFVTLQKMNELASTGDGAGKLLILEFKAIGAGQTMIGFNADETRFMLSDKTSPLFKVVPAQLEISRESITKLSK
jgi:general secretion pathway protein D